MSEFDENLRIDIYGIVNRCNGKIYVGQTKQGYRKRFIQHRARNDGSPFLRRAMEKYGKDNFECELLDVAYSRAEANIKEKLWIKLLKTCDVDCGYNLSKGGVIGDFSDQVKKQMSLSRMGENNNFFGKHHTEEAKQKMRDSKIGRYTREKHPRAKKVKCVETGKIYDCIRDAADDTGANAHHIGAAAKNQYGRKTAGGFHWELA